MSVMMMRSLVKSLLARTLARETKTIKWKLVTFNLYYLEHKGFQLYKRNIFKNYWRFVVSDGITQCTFDMYEKER